MKKVLACGMLLGLLTAVSFAQHQRTGFGGTMPGARLPNAVPGAGSPNHGTFPGTFPSQGQAAPNAHTTGVQPNSVTPATPNTVRPNPTMTPDRVQLPDTQNGTNRTAGPPIR